MTDTPLKILVADDDPVIGDTFRHILTGLGHACDITHDGKDCLKQIAQLHYDILFLDLIMPKLDGEAVLHALHGREPQMSIVVISSEDAEDVIRDILRRGATAYIVKPVTLQSVESVINDIIGKRTQSGEAPKP